LAAFTTLNIKLAAKASFSIPEAVEFVPEREL
jgi:hypothetical protein